MGSRQPSEFDALKYAHDREHELKLNEFTHNLEMEQLKLMILLNGGAAAALLTFAEKAVSGPAIAALVLPIALWLLGLWHGTQATLIMRKAQSGYSKFYRHRRHATEFSHLSGPRASRPSLSPEDYEKLGDLARSEPVLADALRSHAGDVLHRRLAAEAIGEARTHNDSVHPQSFLSLRYFIFGAAAAALIVALSPFADSAG